MLPDGYAAVAVNVDLRSGVLRSLRNPGLLTNIAAIPANSGVVRVEPKAVFALSRDGLRRWAMFLDPEARIVRSPVANDAADRVFATTSIGGGVTNGINGIQYNSWSRFVSADPFYRLGLPNGPSTFNVTVAGGTGATVTRVYGATWGTSFGEESVLGTTLSVSGKEDGTWTVQSYPATPPASPGPNAIKWIRFYRATQAAGAFRFVRQVDLQPDPSFVASFTDTVSEASLAVRFGPPTDAFAPPEDLRGLVSHPNGFLAAYRGRDVFMSVPFLPHAWPPSNVVRMQSDVVALNVVGDMIAVLTKGAPAMLVGSTPESITVVRYEQPFPCLDARSVVSYKGRTFYASNDGLVSLGLEGPMLISTRWITVEQWDQSWRQPDQTAVMWENYYVSIGGTTGFMLSVDGDEGVTRLRLPIDVKSVSVLDDDGTFCLATTTALYEWLAPGSFVPMPYTWTSKTILTPKPLNFSAFTVKFSGAAVVDEPPPPDTAQIAYNNAVFPALTGALGTVALGGLKTFPATLPTTVGPPSLSPLGFGGLYTTDPFFSMETGAPLFIRVDADNRTVFERPQFDENLRRLPVGYKSARWSVTLTGHTDVSAYAMAETGRELADAL